MSANVSVITNNTKDSISAVVDAFNGAVLAHINGDFGAHNVCRVYATPFVEQVTGHVVSDHSLRIQVFNPNTDQTVALIVPCFVIGSTTNGGPPVILIQPVNTSAVVGTTPQLNVSVASQTTPSYQWQRLLTPGFSNIGGQTSSILVFPNVQTTDAGAYRVVVSNSFGSVVSNTGSLTVTTSGGGGGGGCLLPGTLILMADGTNTKKVEDVQVGDVLASYDGPPVTVQALLPNNYHRHYRINNRLHITWEHPIAIQTGGTYTLTMARDVRSNDIMCTFNGTEKVVTKEEVPGNVDTYNFNVDGNHLYIADGIVVHNPTVQKT